MSHRLVSPPRLRRGLPPRFVGPAAVLALSLGYAALWLANRPDGIPAASYVGQLFGAESILLLSISLVLISMLPWVEGWFDGIDRAAIWHRRLALTGLALLLPHVLYSSNPDHSTRGPLLGLIGLFGMAGLAVWAILPRWRSMVPRPGHVVVEAALRLPGLRHVFSLLGGYERWRSLHRTTGIFVFAGFLHGVLDGSPFDRSALLRWSFVAVGATGLAFYVYRELLTRWFLSLHDYQIGSVTPVGAGIIEVTLRPLGKPMRFLPGQFAMVYLEGKDGWHRHPFTIASAPSEAVVRLTVKGLGDYTTRLGETLEPGMPAVIGGPHGRFSHVKGTRRQVWIAGGVGIAPFLSWLRSLGDGPAPQVDFFYSSDGDAPFADELARIAEAHTSLRVHLVDTRRDGRLTPESVLTTIGSRVEDVSVFMCGPKTMLRSFRIGLRAAGVRPWRIHHEYFDWR
jgi:predicted ferric reductase